MLSTGRKAHGGLLVITAPRLAAELRRRRGCRRALVEQLEQTNDTTWVPDDLRRAPTNLLVLAAMNLANRRGIRDT